MPANESRPAGNRAADDLSGELATPRIADAADFYRSGYENGHADGYREGQADDWERALAEWCDVATTDPYTVVQPYERPPFVPSKPAGSGRHLVDKARASWAQVERRIREKRAA